MAGVIAKGDREQDSEAAAPTRTSPTPSPGCANTGIVPWEWIEDRTRHSSTYRG